MWTRTAARGRLPFALEAEVAMKLRIFSREESFFDLFEAAADNMAQSARLLDDLLQDFVDPELKAKRLVECEHEGDRITHAILTWLNSTFITPFDREDIYALAAQLDDVVDAVEEAADMLVLHKVEEPIDPVREQARIILKAAEETARGLRHLRKLDLSAPSWKFLGDRHAALASCSFSSSRRSRSSRSALVKRQSNGTAVCSYRRWKPSSRRSTSARSVTSLGVSSLRCT